MNSGIIERRRVLNDEVTINPPQPILSVYPSMGNTLTAYSASNDRSFNRSNANSITVTNPNHTWWDDGVQLQDLVDMTNYDSIQCTRSGTDNMVWCFIYCPDTIGADLSVYVTYHYLNGTSVADNLNAVTTSTMFINLDLENAFDSMSGGIPPNDGHPYLDEQNLDYITVSAGAFKDGLWSTEKSFNIYFSSSVVIKAPRFDPSGGTYNSQQSVNIFSDTSLPGVRTYFTISNTSEDPDQTDALYVEGRPIILTNTCYLNAKSFLTMESGNIISSQTTSYQYIITNGGDDLNPPTFTPTPGIYNDAQTVYITNPNQSGVIYYTLDGSNPSVQSNQYTYPIQITDTTTVTAAVYDSTTNVWSEFAIGTYTIDLQNFINEISYLVNSDGTTSCGLYQLAKKEDTGNNIENYGFSIGGSNKSTIVYFTLDGSEPTTSSQYLTNGRWYSLTRPNTVLVKYKAVAPNCLDKTGEFWVRVNKCAAVYRYSGNKFIIGTSYCNWINSSLTNYNFEDCVYIYLNGNQLYLDSNFNVEYVDINGSNIGLLTFTPSQSTAIDSTFTFIYGYSSPNTNYDNNGYNYCPFNLIKEYYGLSSNLYSGLKNNVFNNRTGAEVIYVSSNELDTLRVSGQLHLNDLNFAGCPPIVSQCDSKTRLEYGTISYTNLTRIDLSPCFSLVRLDDHSLSGTFANNYNETGLISVIMPYRVSSLGDGILSKPDSNIVRRPINVTFFNPSIPQITANTFGDYQVSSNSYSPIDSNSTIIVNYEPCHASVCSYENAWHYHQTRSGNNPIIGSNLTNMRIIDQDGLGCGEVPGSIPTVVTGTAESITLVSAIVSANNVTNDGGYQISTRGVCWGINNNPTTADNHINHSTASTGTYSISLSNLSSSTLYHYRAYATNELGIAYGQDKTFTTLSEVTSPIIDTGPYEQGATSQLMVYGMGSGTNLNGSISGWKIMNDGGSQILETAVVYSTSNNNPTMADNHVSTTEWITDGILHFSGQISGYGLQPNVTVYIRGAARNSNGWSYSSTVQSYTTISGQVVDPSVTIGTTGLNYQLGVHEVGSLLYPSSIYFNCQVICGTYGNVIVQFIYGTNSIPTEGVGDAVVVTADQSPTYSDGQCSYTMDSIEELESLQLNATYHVRARIKQSTSSQWIYSNVNDFVNSYYLEDVHTVSVNSITSDSATVLCRFNGVQPLSNNTYGIYGCEIYDEYPSYYPSATSSIPPITFINETGSVLTNYERSLLFTNLKSSTTYYAVAIQGAASFGHTDVIWHGEILEFTTGSSGDGIINVNDTELWALNRRRPAEVNLSFDRWWNWTYTYSWGYDNRLGDLILTNSWDFIGNSEGNLNDNYGDNRDLFGWGCTSQSHRSSKYEAWALGINASDFRAYDSTGSNLTNQNKNGRANWAWQTERSNNDGYYQATDFIYSGTGMFDFSHSYPVPKPDDLYAYGGGLQVLWQDASRPLNSSEMNYALNTRNTPTGVRFCKGRINKASNNYINGLIIFYQNWNGGFSLNGVNNIGSSYESNTITIEQWNNYFKDRAVFLPAAGYGIITSSGNVSVIDVNSGGYYWLNDSYSPDRAYCLSFSPLSVSIISVPKNYRCSVRLFNIA